MAPGVLDFSPDEALSPAMPPVVASALSAQPAPQASPRTGVLGTLGHAVEGVASLPINLLGVIGSNLENRLDANAYQRLMLQANVTAMQRHLEQIQATHDKLVAAGKPDEADKLYLDPDGWIKSNQAVWQASNTAHDVKSGDTFYDPGSGKAFTAPVLGMTKDNQGFTQTPEGVTATGALPTIQSAAPGTSIEPMAPVGVPAAGLPGLPAGPVAAPDAPVMAAAPASAAPSTAQGTPTSVPRGIRNNNWGNLRALPKGQWQGQTGVDKDGYVQFASPQDGIRAAIANLRVYGQKHGLSNVAQIAGRWAPQAAGNDVGSYAKTVAQQAGVDVNVPLDMSDPKTLARLAHGIAVAENGQAAVNHAAQSVSAGPSLPAVAAGPAATPAPTDGAPGPAGLPTALHGKTNTDISPMDAMAQGLAPGKWQITPTREKVQVSKAPEADVKRITDLSAGLDTLHQLENNQTKFMTYNDQAPGTGLKYMDIEHRGHDMNPFTAGDIATSPPVSQMHALAQSQVLMVKPANAGARILQSELPLWQEAVQGIDQTPGVNRERLNDTRSQIAYMSAKKAFLETFLYHHGNLQGADPAFTKWWSGTKYAAKQLPATLPGASKPAGGPVHLGSNPDADFAALAPGTQYIGPDGVVRAK